MILETFGTLLMRVDCTFPKPEKVVSARKAHDLYVVTGYSKEQITTFCAGSASGEVIPPMHIFAGQQMSYNPLERAGRSSTWCILW